MADKFLIANFQTGFDEELQPWLLPQDAFIRLEDGFVFKGVLQPRKGIQEFATGGINSTNNTVSRIVGTVTETLTNSDTLPAVDITATGIPLPVGAIQIVDGTGGYFVTIDSSNTFSGDVLSVPAPTINRTTGQITFTWDTGSATDSPKIYYSGSAESNPVVGIGNLFQNDGTRQLVCCSTTSASLYRPATNTFIGIPFSHTTGALSAFTGNNSNFFSFTNYPDKAGNPRLMMVNNVDAPAFFDGNIIKTFTVLIDNPDYAAPPQGVLNTALHCFYFGERILFLRPTIAGITYKNGILYSGIRDAAGDGDKFNVPGAGLIELSDDSPIQAAVRLRDKLIIWTDENIWELNVTSEFELPLLPRLIATGEYRGSQCPYSGAKWLSSASAVGGWGIVGTDARQAQRVDQRIPFFTRDRIYQSRISSVFGSSIPETSQWWWCYPDKDDAEGAANFPSSRILTYNYDEQNWAIYKLRMNCLGYFRTTFEITWDDVNEDLQPDWAQWDTTDDIWDDFFSQSNVNFSLGGDNLGFIYRLEADQDDFISAISGVTNAPQAVITVAEPDLFKVGDKVAVYGVTGIELNGESLINYEPVGSLEVVAVGGSTITVNQDTSLASAYISGGYLQKLIEFVAETKPLNPYSQQDKKCKLIKIYFFVSTGTHNFFVDFFTDRGSTPYLERVEIDCSTPPTGDNKKWVPVTVNTTASFHRLRITQPIANPDCRIQGMLWITEPVGRLF